MSSSNHKFEQNYILLSKSCYGILKLWSWCTQNENLWVNSANGVVLTRQHSSTSRYVKSFPILEHCIAKLVYQLVRTWTTHFYEFKVEILKNNENLSNRITDNMVRTSKFGDVEVTNLFRSPLFSVHNWSVTWT